MLWCFFDTILETAIYIRPKSFFLFASRGICEQILQSQVQLAIQDTAVQEEEEGESLSDQLEKLLAKYEDSETLQEFFLEGTLWWYVLISKQRGKGDGNELTVNS